MFAAGNPCKPNIRAVRKDNEAASGASRLHVICDTREQRPLHFGPHIEVTRRALKTGDYSAAGYEQRVTVERKSVPDLHGCIGRDRERFERELERLRTFDYAAIVVEGGLREILTLDGRMLDASAVLGSVVAWTLDGVPVVPCDSPELAAAFVERFLTKAVKRLADREKSAPATGKTRRIVTPKRRGS